MATQQIRPSGALRIMTVLALLTAGLASAAAQGTAEPVPARSPAGGPQTWRVATRPISPFVIVQGRELSGFSVDLWRALGAEIGVATEFKVVPTLPALLDTVAAGQADLGIAAISITSEREQRFDFSLPMFDAGLQIAVRADTSSPAAEAVEALRSIVVSRGFAEFLGLAGLLLLVPTFFVWLLDRRHEEGIVPRDSVAGGLGKSLFWTLSILSGQAEELPRTVLARAIGLLWAFTAIALITWFTATLTTTMTLDRLRGEITGPQDLPGKRIGTVAYSTAAAYLGNHFAIPVEYPTVEEAVSALAAGKVVGLVYDAPVLRYLATRDAKDRIRIVGPIFRKESYGILFQERDARRKRVNEALLRLRESGRYEILYNRWFGTDPSETR